MSLDVSSAVCKNEADCCKEVAALKAEHCKALEGRQEAADAMEEDLANLSKYNVYLQATAEQWYEAYIDKDSLLQHTKASRYAEHKKHEAAEETIVLAMTAMRTQHTAEATHFRDSVDDLQRKLDVANDLNGNLVKAAETQCAELAALQDETLREKAHRAHHENQLQSQIVRLQDEAARQKRVESQLLASHRELQDISLKELRKTEEYKARVQDEAARREALIRTLKGQVVLLEGIKATPTVPTDSDELQPGTPCVYAYGTSKQREGYVSRAGVSPDDAGEPTINHIDRVGRLLQSCVPCQDVTLYRYTTLERPLPITDMQPGPVVAAGYKSLNPDEAIKGTHIVWHTTLPNRERGGFINKCYDLVDGGTPVVDIVTHVGNPLAKAVRLEELSLSPYFDIGR